MLSSTHHKHIDMVEKQIDEYVWVYVELWWNNVVKKSLVKRKGENEIENIWRRGFKPQGLHRIRRQRQNESKRRESRRKEKMNKKEIFKLAKGFRGRAKNCIRIARERVEKALQYSYRDRRNKKRDMRSLWIQRINAGTRQHGVSLLYLSFSILHYSAYCIFYLSSFDTTHYHTLQEALKIVIGFPNLCV